MKIQHLINGAAVASAQYFETVNPATQDVLAEVARGGEREVDAAVAAAKAAFPAWAGRPAAERAALLRKLREDRNRRYGPGDRADREAAGAALGG